MRRCIATGRVMPRSALLRFALGPDGTLLPDVCGDLPGRGMWITPARDMIDRARKKNLFAKAAKAPIRIAGDLAEQAEALVLRRCLDCLGLARRAGQLVAGFEKAKASLMAGRAAVLVQACDAGEDGRRKLRELANRQPGVCVVDEVFLKSELGQALGREDSVHMAIASGGLADRFMVECVRLQALRGTPGPDSGRFAQLK